MTISRGVLDDVLHHAREAQPNECCGILIGTDGRILEAVRTRNLADSSTRYEIDPRDHFEARRTARARGRSIVGFYHSHPHSPPQPSAADRAEAVYDDVVYLIAGVVNAEWAVKVYRLTKGEVDEVPLTVMP